MMRITRPSRSRTFAASAATAFTVAAAPIASAQMIDNLTRVEQLVEDRSPLAQSFRVFEHELMQPQGFDQLYTSPAFPGQLLRIDGALIAAFPLSEYALIEIDREEDLIPVIPEGTVFYIGGPPRIPGMLDPVHPSGRPIAGGPPPQRPDDARFISRDEPGRLNSRISHRLPSAQPGARDGNADIAESPERPTVWSDPVYRASRLDAILRTAAQRDRQG